MVACLTVFILLLNHFQSAADWVTHYGSLTLTITGLVGVGVVIMKYPHWVLSELLPQPMYEGLSRNSNTSPIPQEGEESPLLVQTVVVHNNNVEADQ